MIAEPSILDTALGLLVALQYLPYFGVLVPISPFILFVGI